MFAFATSICFFLFHLFLIPFKGLSRNSSIILNLSPIFEIYGKINEKYAAEERKKAFLNENNDCAVNRCKLWRMKKKIFGKKSDWRNLRPSDMYVIQMLLICKESAFNSHTLFSSNHKIQSQPTFTNWLFCNAFPSLFFLPQNRWILRYNRFSVERTQQFKIVSVNEYLEWRIAVNRGINSIFNEKPLTNLVRSGYQNCKYRLLILICKCETCKNKTSKQTKWMQAFYLTWSFFF